MSGDDKVLRRCNLIGAVLAGAAIFVLSYADSGGPPRMSAGLGLIVLGGYVVGGAILKTFWDMAHGGPKSGPAAPRGDPNQSSSSPPPSEEDGTRR